MLIYKFVVDLGFNNYNISSIICFILYEKLKYFIEKHFIEILKSIALSFNEAPWFRYFFACFSDAYRPPQTSQNFRESRLDPETLEKLKFYFGF